ncbi:hypothetical protein [Candidatus Stoquefichus massiliensis]|uniref:hypothetical protein n=1 Tax=Candidatus Stoquefichus massiliensis TaxID=1470350 RepID=UPI0004812A8F|nr:hypothetical protein [Candidatus Stoquefichus massiliensis]
MDAFILFFNLVEGILYSIFIAQSLSHNISKHYSLISLFSFIIFIDISIYNYFTYSEILYALLLQLILFSFSTCIRKCNYIINLFICLLIDLLSIFANTLAIMLNQIIFINQPLSLHILIVISKIIFLIFVLTIPPYLHKLIDSEYAKNWYFNIALISLLGLYTLAFDSLFYETEMNIQLYIIIICVLILTISLYKVFQYVIDTNKKKTEAQLTIKELSLNQKNYHFLRYSLDALSHSQHEMIYILSHIKKLNHQNSPSIDQFIDSQINIINQKIKPIISGNSTLDYILYQYIPIFQEKNIRIIYTNAPSACPIPNILYYTIMNQILDFAIESCQQNKSSQIYIYHGYMKRNFFTKVTFPLSKSFNIDHIDHQLKDYHHIVICEENTNVYLLGFMIIDD